MFFKKVSLFFLSAFIIIGCEPVSKEGKSFENSKPSMVDNDKLPETESNQISVNSSEENFWELDSKSEYNNLKIEKTIFPLDNENGIPFYENELGVAIEGFEVDKDGNYIFIGGDKITTLVKYSKGNLIYRKKYDNIPAGAITIINDSVLVILDTYKNGLHWIDHRNGDIIQSFERILDNQINSCFFSTSYFIVEAFNVTDNINPNTELSLLKFDFQGNLLGFVENMYNVPKKIINVGVDGNGVSGNWVLGQWNNKYVKLLNDRGKFFAFILSEQGDILGLDSVRVDRFGEYSFFGNYNEHYLLKKDKIYLLGQNDNNIVISSIDIKSIASTY